MRTKSFRLTKKFSAALLSAALCLGSAGPAAVSALSQVVAAPIEAVGASRAAAGGVFVAPVAPSSAWTLSPAAAISGQSMLRSPAPLPLPGASIGAAAQAATPAATASGSPAAPRFAFARFGASAAAAGLAGRHARNPNSAAEIEGPSVSARPAEAPEMRPSAVAYRERTPADPSQRAPGAIFQLRLLYRRLAPIPAAVDSGEGGGGFPPDALPAGEGSAPPPEADAPGGRRLDKITTGGVSRPEEIAVTFRTDPYASTEEAAEALGRLGLRLLTRTSASLGPQGPSYTLAARDGVAAGQAALALSADGAVTGIRVHGDVARHYHLGQRPASDETPAAPLESASPAQTRLLPADRGPGTPEETPPSDAAPGETANPAVGPETRRMPPPAPRALPRKLRSLAELGPGEAVVRFRERVGFALLQRLRALGVQGAAIEDHKRGAAARVSFGGAAEAADRAAALAKLDEVRGVDVSPAAAELLRAAPPSEPATEAPAETRPPARSPSPRDAAKAFVDFLNARTLSDGKSTLTPKQVALLMRFLKPVQAKPDAPPLPVIARNEEIKTALPILASPRGMRNSVILVGPAGVGKTAVAEGLAQLIEEVERGGDRLSGSDYLQARRLKGRWLLEFNIDELLSMGADEDPMAALKAVLTLLPMLNDPDPKAGNEIILVFDEIQKLFLDRSGIGLKVANYLKRPLRDGQVSILATITEKEFKEYVEPDDAFRRRLEPIAIREPAPEHALEMLRGLKRLLEERHDTAIPDETLVAAVKLSHQFDKENFLPDKAIKLVEDAAELTRPDTLRTFLGMDIRETWRKLSVALHDARRTLEAKAIPSAVALPVELYNRIAALATEAERLYRELAAVQDGRSATSPDLVRKLLAKKKEIKSGQLTLGDEDATRYLKMEEEMAKRVIHQEKAISALAKAIRRNKAALSVGKRPIGKFLMPGPTGVGKTYFAKELARFLFHDPDAMIRFDMSEYMHDHEVSKLIGSPPGYVGHEEAGQLTEQVRKKPYSVVLFDEIEKAHPRVWDILLQILDDGRLTDGKGRTVDFSNTVILMTSNVGMAAVDSEKFEKRLAAAATPEEKARLEAEWDAEIAAAIREGVREAFRPEFLNRLDQNPDADSKEQWITFNRLRREDARAIAELQVGEFARSLRERHDTDLEVSDAVYDFLAARGFSAAYGARPMEKALEKFIIDPLAEWILQEEAAGRKNARGGLVRISVRDGATRFEVLPKPPAETPKAEVGGAAKPFTQAALEALEGALGGGFGLPDEQAFHDLMSLFMRGSPNLPRASADSTAPETAGRREDPASFRPDAALPMPAGAPEASAANDNPGSKDDNLAYETKKLLQAADERGWPEREKSLLQAAAPSEGDGWIKLFIRHAKEQVRRRDAAAPAFAQQAPIRLAWEVTHASIRVLIHRDGEADGAEAAFLKAHFTGAPPETLAEARRKADLLNVPGSALVMNHFLWNLHGKIARTPGARTGYATGAEARGGAGTDYWLEISKKNPEAAPSASDAGGAAGAENVRPAAALTPHQERERDKVKGLMLKVLRSREQADNPAVQVAAATGYSIMASPRDAAAVRSWIDEYGWADASGRASDVKDKWPLVMAALLVLERFGGPEDIPLVETIARKLPTSDYEHLYRPIRGAAGAALTALYARAGVEETRRALARSAGRDAHEAVHRAALGALGRFGALEDAEALNHQPEALIALLDRVAPERLRDLMAQHWPSEAKADNHLGGEKWTGNSDERKRTLILLAGRGTDQPDKDLEVLKALLHERLSAERPTLYLAARAWADIVTRRRMTRGLVDEMKKYLDGHSLTHYGGTTGWPILLAYVYALQQTGGPEALAELENIMKENPGSVQASHEESFFEAPVTWAKVAVRNGLMPELLRPAVKEDGSRGPSRLEAMLASPNPMLGAAALYALALARDAADSPASPGSAEPASGRAGAPAGELPVPSIHDRASATGESHSSVSAPFHQGHLPFRHRPDIDRYDPLGPY